MLRPVTTLMGVEVSVRRPQCGRFANAYDRLPETLTGLYVQAFVILMLKNVASVLA
jgi:hypothetical protein